MFPAYYVFNFLLTTLLILHLFWGYFIIKVAYKVGTNNLLATRNKKNFPLRWCWPMIQWRIQGVSQRAPVTSDKELKDFYSLFWINDWSLHFGKVCYIFSLSQREKLSTEAFANEMCLLTYFWNEFSGPSVFLWSWMVLDHLSSLEATRINLRPV